MRSSQIFDDLLHSYPASPLSWRTLALSMFVFLVIPVTVAYASFFSIFEDIFSKVSTQEQLINSQNMALLSASIGLSTAYATTTPEIMTVGESALLADVGPEGGLPDVDNRVENQGQISIYTVREGDSIASIAKMFDVSANTIVWANNIARGGKIVIGETLAILPVTGVQYTVKKGDTIASIAKKYKGDEDEIRSYNGFEEGGVLALGSLVIIPDGEIVTPVVAPKPKSKTTSKLRNASGPNYEGYYKAPLANYRRTQGLHGYNGIDLVSHDGLGAYVSAAAAGEVIISKDGCKSRGCNGGYGNYVVIKHSNGTQTLYGHLKGNAVSAGTYVAQGQLIGYEGNSGRSTGTHLHFEVRGAKNPF